MSDRIRTAWLALVLALSVLTTGNAMAQDRPREIIISGEGQVSAAPDLATITMGVTQEADTAAGALDAVSAATGAVIEVLKSRNIEAKDMQTSQLTLNPKWTYRKAGGREYNEITGYTASNMVTVIVRDLADLGGILDAVVQSGANDFRGLQFGFEDSQVLMDGARDAAVKDALRKARLLAQSAGVTLGAIQSISEAGSPVRPFAMAEARMAADSAVPIAEGELSLQARVSVVFAIADE